MITFASATHLQSPRSGSLGHDPRGRSASSSGFIMFDVMLWMGLGLGIAATALIVFVSTWGSTNVAQAQSWVQQTAQSAMASYASRADFSLLNQSSAQREGLFPAGAMAGGQLVNPWGGDFAISGVNTPLKYMGAALIVMDQVPAHDCDQLVAFLAMSADSVTVDGAVVSSGHSRPDPVVTGTACQAQGRLAFTYVKR